MFHLSYHNKASGTRSWRETFSVEQASGSLNQIIARKELTLTVSVTVTHSTTGLSMGKEKLGDLGFLRDNWNRKRFVKFDVDKNEVEYEL